MKEKVKKMKEKMEKNRCFSSDLDKTTSTFQNKKEKAYVKTAREKFYETEKGKFTMNLLNSKSFYGKTTGSFRKKGFNSFHERI